MYTSMHKISVPPLCVKSRDLKFELWVFLTQEKKQKKMLEDLRYFLLHDYLHFKWWIMVSSTFWVYARFRILFVYIFRVQKDPPPSERYGEVEGDGQWVGRWAMGNGSGDGRWAMGRAIGDGLGDPGDGWYATKMQLQFLNYALVSSFSQIQNNQFRPQF